MSDTPDLISRLTSHIHSILFDYGYEMDTAPYFSTRKANNGKDLETIEVAIATCHLPGNKEKRFEFTIWMWKDLAILCSDGPYWEIILNSFIIRGLLESGIKLRKRLDEAEKSCQSFDQKMKERDSLDLIRRGKKTDE